MPTATPADERSLSSVNSGAGAGSVEPGAVGVVGAEGVVGDVGDVGEVGVDPAGPFTVTVHEVVRPPLSLVAVMIAVPPDIATTFPFGSTLATLSSLDVHDTPDIVGLEGL